MSHPTSMHLIPKETVVSILGHLSERERIRLLSTCKRMHEWLKERLKIARNAFDAFKAHCTTIRWRKDNEMKVSYHRVLGRPGGTKRLSTFVCLEANGLIYIIQTEEFTTTWGRSLPAFEVGCYFAPWFHELTSHNGDTETHTRYPDSVVRMLMDASPRLV